MTMRRLHVDRLPTNPLHALAGISPPPWMIDAVCATTDPEAFFPEKGGSTREAKKICAGCTVAAECLDYAIANGERFGIYGGLSERERRKVEAAMGIRSVNGNDTKTHCDNGHEFTEANTYQRPTGGRDCRACLRESQARHRRNAS